jgi:anhydro-N-acetylmuramic acid kinase
MAALETDGVVIEAFGPAGERALGEEVRALVLAATADARSWAPGTPEPDSFAPARAAITREHWEAGTGFLAAHGMTWSDFDLIGMHGQTVLHDAPRAGRAGRTTQLGDAAWLARRAGIPVAYDFRAADIAAGGEGAPLAPVYHAALAARSGLATPVAALNLGGVANITLVGRAEEDLRAFDTGPANGMIDLWLQEKTGARFDVDGRCAAAGRVDDAALAAFLSHPHFTTRGPKSLDRYAFPLTPVAALSVEDGAATLTAFAAEAVALGVAACAPRPRQVIACGGGRRNCALMAALRARVGVEVCAAEDVGWRGDSIEAEAFAYLAARTARALPISFPGTTGVRRPLTGGRIATP